MSTLQTLVHGADGSPNDVDREFFALLIVMDESGSHYLEAERTKLTASDDVERIRVRR